MRRLPSSIQKRCIWTKRISRRVCGVRRLIRKIQEVMRQRGKRQRGIVSHTLAPGVSGVDRRYADLVEQRKKRRLEDGEGAEGISDDEVCIGSSPCLPIHLPPFHRSSSALPLHFSVLPILTDVTPLIDAKLSTSLSQRGAACFHSTLPPAVSTAVLCQLHFLLVVHPFISRLLSSWRVVDTLANVLGRSSITSRFWDRRRG